MLGSIGRMAQSIFLQDFTDQTYEDTLDAIRHALSKQRTTLPKLIILRFEYEKEKFTREQLSQLFLIAGLVLNEEQLQSLFRNLDPDANGVIFVGALGKAVGELMSDSRLSIQSNQSSIGWMDELARHLRSTGPYQTLQYFDDDSDGVMTLSELMQYLTSVEMPTGRRAVGKAFFMKADNVPISEILLKLGIGPEQQFVENNGNAALNCSLLQMSKSLTGSKIVTNPSEQKPSSQLRVIEQYRNPCTEISQPLLSTCIKYIGAGKLFIDQQNPQLKPGLTYKHSKEIFGQSYFLFEVQKSIVRMGIGAILDSRNIIQGKGKDCYFLSAAAGIVEHYPEFIYRLFVLDKNPSDIYGVRLFIDGEWRTVILDAGLPVDDRGILYYAKPYRSEIWVLLLEKAWAKVYGSYDNIEGGNPEEGLTALTGAPCIKITGEDPMVIEKLRYFLQQRYIVTANTSELVNAMDKADQKLKGIYENHAYTIVGLLENLVWERQGKTDRLTLIKMRNPWGRGSWKGNWGFDCPLWTKQLRKQLNYTRDPKNGSFFISVSDFLLMFGTMKVCLLSPVNQNCSLRMTSKKKEFAFARITVKQQGMYFLSIHQQGTRSYKLEPTKAKHSSISHIFVAAVASNGFLFPTGSKAHNREKNHLELWLGAGDYVVFCRIKWAHTEQGEFVLGSYGPGRVLMLKMDPVPKHIYDYVHTKALDEKGEKTTYGSQGHPESFRITNVSVDEGYGYIIFVNNSYQHMKVELTLGEHRGIKAIAPGTLPLCVMVPPKSRYILGLLIEPKAKYSFQENTQFI